MLYFCRPEIPESPASDVYPGHPDLLKRSEDQHNDQAVAACGVLHQSVAGLRRIPSSRKSTAENTVRLVS